MKCCAKICSTKRNNRKFEEIVATRVAATFASVVKIVARQNFKSLWLTCFVYRGSCCTELRVVLDFVWKLLQSFPLSFGKERRSGGDCRNHWKENRISPLSIGNRCSHNMKVLRKSTGMSTANPNHLFQRFSKEYLKPRSRFLATFATLNIQFNSECSLKSLIAIADSFPLLLVFVLISSNC